MSVRIGINPLSWTNDDLPAMGAESSLEICLSEGKQAGYSGFELGNKFPREPGILGPILEQHDLSLVSVWFSGQLLVQSVEAEIVAMQSHLNLLKALGAKTMVYCEVTGCIHGQRQTPASKRPQLMADQWQAFGKNLTKVAEHCLAEGVRLSYHHHMGTVVQSAEDIDVLMEHTGDAVGLLLDTGHVTFADADPMAIQNRYANRISHVHCKDVRSNVLANAKNRDLSFLDAVLNGAFTVPGDGSVDYYSLVQGLSKANYSGWLVVEAEQDPSVAPSLAYAKTGRANLQNFCGAAGLQIAP